jgi:hypothetical protein
MKQVNSKQISNVMALVVFFAFTKMPLQGHIHLIVTAAKARTNLHLA